MVILQELKLRLMKTKLILIAFIIGVIACHHDDHHANSVSNQIKEGEKHYDGVSVSSEDLTEGIKTHPVEIGDRKFHIRERESQIKSFPCTDCHSSPVNQIQTKGEKKAHWDIKLDHASDQLQQVMSAMGTIYLQLTNVLMTQNQKRVMYIL